MSTTTDTIAALDRLHAELESIVPQFIAISGDKDATWADGGITWDRAASALHKAQTSDDGTWTIAFGVTGEYGWGEIHADGRITRGDA